MQSHAERGWDMSQWNGAAAVCLNERGELLMVLQGKPEETKRWSVPSGGAEHGETFEQCCAREVYEETGYIVEVGKLLHEKRGERLGSTFYVRYFEAACVGGARALHDPDGLIYDVVWQPLEAVRQLDLCFIEDRDVLLRYMEAKLLSIDE
jgi:aminoglycoside 6'-N-acetyltransferase